MVHYLDLWRREEHAVLVWNPQRPKVRNEVYRTAKTMGLFHPMTHHLRYYKIVL
jgi:hypothetical protein